ncbi:hypothetical protein ACFQ67_00200 [Streptomyces sp. NPDC056488]|uniref:hypothetical protein n=1 Tax=Streptomyces sp. NPDC056488 TaxID=3345836 RepID=UPI00369FFB8D
MTTAEEAPETPAEAPDGVSRAAGGCVLVIGLGIAGGVAYAVPESAYYVAGLLTAAGARKARTWTSRRREVAEEEPEPVDIVAVLQQLGEGGQHVRLTQLQEAAGLPTTKAVRALLDEAGVPVRPGVRAGGKNGPGVHQDDIPTPLPVSGAPSGTCVCAGHAANANTNNTGGEGSGEGLRVDRIGHAGTVVHTPAEAARHYSLAKT